MLRKEVQQWLLQQAEQDYKTFSASLIPGVENLLGIRLPVLRKKAKEIAKADWKEYLAFSDYLYFEEGMLQGMVLGYVRAPLEEILAEAEKFIPRIDNWSVNDSFCNSFKIAEKYPEEVWDFLMKYAGSQEVYEVRVVAVMLLSHYLEEEYIDRVLKVLGNLHIGGYYASMAVAWAYATAWGKFPEKTRAWLLAHPIDKETYQKTLQKCLESYRIEEEEKAWIRQERQRMKEQQMRAQQVKGQL